MSQSWIFNVANMSFKAIRENKILPFTVDCSASGCLQHWVLMIYDYTANRHEITVLLPNPFDDVRLNIKLCHLQ